MGRRAALFSALQSLGVTTRKSASVAELEAQLREAEARGGADGWEPLLTCTAFWSELGRLQWVSVLARVCKSWAFVISRSDEVFHGLRAATPQRRLLLAKGFVWRALLLNAQDLVALSCVKQTSRRGYLYRHETHYYNAGEALLLCIEKYGGMWAYVQRRRVLVRRNPNVLLADYFVRQQREANAQFTREFRLALQAEWSPVHQDVLRHEIQQIMEWRAPPSKDSVEACVADAVACLRSIAEQYRPAFERADIDAMRRRVVQRLHERFPDLERKTIRQWCHFSLPSRLANEEVGFCKSLKLIAANLARAPRRVRGR